MTRLSEKMNTIWPIEKILETFEKNFGSRKIMFHQVKIFKILKWRDENKICHVRHDFVSRLRGKNRLSLILRALDIPGLFNYFSYPHHGQKVRKIFLESFEGKSLPQRWGKSEISRWLDQLENSKFIIFFTFLTIAYV